MTGSGVSSKFAKLAWLVVSVFYAYQYIIRVMPNVMLSEIMEKFRMDAAGFGQFSGIYYVSYSLMHIPVGILLDRYGPKKIVPVSMVLTACGMLPVLLSSDPFYAIAGRFLLGIGSSGAILGVFSIVRSVFPEKKFSRMLSLSVTIGLMGAMYGGGPVAYLKNGVGYESVIRIFGFTGIALAAVAYLILPEGIKEPKSSILSGVKEVFSNRYVLASCVLAGLMVGPLEGFADVWGMAFLENVSGLDRGVASSLPSLIFLGMCFGGPFLSMIAEKTGSYLGTIVVAALVMGVCFFSLVGSNPPPSRIGIYFVLVGICSSYQILAIYKVSTYVRDGVAGLATAVANMIIMIFGYGFHSVIGTVVNNFGGSKNGKALVAGISVIPIALFCASAGFAFLLYFERKKKAEV